MNKFHVAPLVIGAFLINNITAEEIDGVEEVIVTSSFIDQTLSEIENPLHVVDGESISSGSTQSLGESIDSLLGVSSTDYGSAVGQPVIRGMSGNRVKVLNNGMLVRDVSGIGADHINDIDLTDVQQIEVARGPSSLLFSNGSIGGIINIVDNTIARTDIEKPRVVLGLESQSVNDGHAYDASYQDNLGGLNLSLAFKNAHFDDFDIPDGAIHHHEEEEEEEDHEEPTSLPDSDFKTTSQRVGLSKTGDWGYFGLSASSVESVYGIPFHGEHEEPLPESGNGTEPPAAEPEHEDERIFSTTESNVINLEGSYNFNNAWLNKVDYFFRDSDYSLTEQHAEEEHHEPEEADDHDEEEPTVFSNDAMEYGAIFDLANQTISQKLVLNFVEEDVSIIGEEAFMNPANNKEQSIGYYLSNQLDLFHLDFGIRHNRVSRDGSVSHEEENDVDFFNRDFNNTSFALSLGRDINDSWDMSLGLAKVQRAPSAVELFMHGEHLATGRFEIGDPNLESETSNNIDLTFNYQNEGLFAEVTLFKNDVDHYIYLQDEHHDEGNNDPHLHEGLIEAEYMQADANFSGYEFELGRVFELGTGSLSLALGRDAVSAEFSDGSNIPRIVPARNIYTIGYSFNDLKMELQLKDVDDQTDVAEDEEATEGFSMLDLKVKKSFNLNGSDSLTVSLFANNLLDEVARNHSSFVKEQVPLPGRNLGVKFRLKF